MVDEFIFQTSNRVDNYHFSEGICYCLIDNSRKPSCRSETLILTLLFWTVGDYRFIANQFPKALRFTHQHPNQFSLSSSQLLWVANKTLIASPFLLSPFFNVRSYLISIDALTISKISELHQYLIVCMEKRKLLAVPPGPLKEFWTLLKTFEEGHSFPLYLSLCKPPY